MNPTDLALAMSHSVLEVEVLPACAESMVVNRRTLIERHCTIDISTDDREVTRGECVPAPYTENGCWAYNKLPRIVTWAGFAELPHEDKPAPRTLRRRFEDVLKATILGESMEATR